MDNSNVWLNIFFLVLLTIGNGLFCLSEVALVASRRARLQVMLEDGDKRVPCAMEQHANPTATLATVQTGMTIVAILSGILGESALSGPIASLLVSFGVGEHAAYLIAVVFIVFMVSYMTIVLGELVPKRIAQSNPEGIFCAVAKTLKGISIMMTPFIWLLSVTTEGILKIFGLSRPVDEEVTEEEISAMLDEGSKTGAIEQNERAMVNKVFQLDDRQVGTLMTPRSQIEWINLDDDVKDNVSKLIASRHSHLLVGSGSLDEVKGACTTRQILQDLIEGKDPDFADGLVNLGVVPETLPAMDALETFKHENASMALVIDEYGTVTGLVTTQDLLEAIVGEFGLQTSSRAPKNGASFEVEGLMPLPELQEKLGIHEVEDDEDTADYNTLAGLLTGQLQKVPETGDMVEWRGYRFEVTKMTRFRIDRVRVQALPKEKAEDKPAEGKATEDKAAEDKKA